MNKQRKANGGRGIEWTHTWGVNEGYTANPIRGCKHDCQWRMPDGNVATCYAKTVAENLAQHAYPNGFAHIQELDWTELQAIEKLKTPAGIFIDSMSDLLGAGVPEVSIAHVISVMRRCPQHVFYVLTKNPPKMTFFDWPENVWIGVSAPPTFMFGKELTPEQQFRWYDHALELLGQVDVPVRWTSIEPLSFDVAPLLEKHWNNFEWAVIGAATNGKQTFQPDEKLLTRAWKALGGKPLFMKGNLDLRLAERVCGRWLEEWPLPVPSWREMRGQP